MTRLKKCDLSHPIQTLRVSIYHHLADARDAATMETRMKMSYVRGWN